jgi:hypothetical protein
VAVGSLDAARGRHPVARGFGAVLLVRVQFREAQRDLRLPRRGCRLRDLAVDFRDRAAADHSQHESGKEDRQQQPIESNLGCSLRFDTQGSQVRVFGIQAKLLLSLVSALVSPASAREKKMASFETGSLTTYYLFRSIKTLWINLGLEKSAVGLSN